jgi:acyl dehydratase
MTLADRLGLDPAVLEAGRSRIGVRSVPKNPWVRTFNDDAIRHWAWGIGDDNPLWLEPDHASRSPWGSIIAPPTMLYAADHGPLGPTSEKSKGHGLPGLHGLHAGDRWVFGEPVRCDAVIEATSWLESLEEKVGKDGVSALLQVRTTEYVDASGSNVATLRRTTIRRPRRSGGRRTDGASRAEIKPWVYMPEELAAIAADYETELRRGEEVRYLEDVAEGDSLGHVVKGPLTVMGLITFWMGWGCIFGMADRIAYEYQRDHPASVVVDPLTNVPDFPERAHWGDGLGNSVGLPLGYDIGAQRVSWFSHLLTNWASDHGSVAELEVRLHKPNWVGDTTWVEGVVTGKTEHAITCSLTARNQRGDTHASGQATVLLPHRPPISLS